MSYDDKDWGPRTLGPTAYGSVKERRDMIWNDGNPTAPAAPPLIYTGVKDKAKFFTRGCRGKINQLQIYCIRTAAGTLDLSFSPHPCLGPLYTVTVTPAATWAWVAANFNEMWNYDSLFVWVSRCDADVSWGADALTPPDWHMTTDGGATWIQVARRPYIRAVYDGETPGDVPVSGTINNIPIPSVATEMTTGTIPNIVTNVWTSICNANGAGTMLEARLNFTTSVTPTAGLLAVAVLYGIRIYADGALAYATNNRFICQSEVATSGRSSAGEFYQANVADPLYDITRLAIRLPIQFRRNIEIRAIQSTGGPVTVSGAINVNEMR